jgi:hemoglobin
MQKRLIHPRTVLILVLALSPLPLFTSISAAAAQAAQDKAKPLYARLGGYDAIAAVVDDFFGRMMKDAQLGRFFANLSDDSKKRARQLTVDLLCKVTGGPCFYIGRDMSNAHKGMGINEGDWDQSVKLLKETLNKFKVPEREQGEVLQAISGLKKDIVEVGKK